MMWIYFFWQSLYKAIWTKRHGKSHSNVSPKKDLISTFSSTNKRVESHIQEYQSVFDIEKLRLPIDTYLCFITRVYSIIFTNF